MGRSYPEAHIRAGNLGRPGAGFSDRGPHQPCTCRSHPTHPSTVFCRPACFICRIPTAEHIYHPHTLRRPRLQVQSAARICGRSCRDGQRAPRPAVWVSTSRILPHLCRGGQACNVEFTGVALAFQFIGSRIVLACPSCASRRLQVPDTADSQAVTFAAMTLSTHCVTPAISRPFAVHVPGAHAVVRACRCSQQPWRHCTGGGRDAANRRRNWPVCGSNSMSAATNSVFPNAHSCR